MKRTELRRKSWIKRGTKPLPKVNRERLKRRVQTYAAYLKSAVWKVKRMAAFVRDGFRCTMLVAVEGGYERCNYVDATKTGKNLRGHHTRGQQLYALGEEPLDTIATACRWCHDGHHAGQGWKRNRRSA